METLLHRLMRGLYSEGTPVRSRCASQEIGAAAGSCARTFALARRHLLLNHSLVESKRAGSCVGLWPYARTSRPAPFQQRTNTSCYLAIPTHGFTVVLSVFRGTPPEKPLDCKIQFKSSGAHRPALIRAGGEPRLSRAALCFLAGDIF